MRVLLVNPPAYDGVKIVREGRCMQRQGAWTAVWAPVSLALTAAVLEAAGQECRLHDCITEEIDPPLLEALTAEFRPDAVLINTATPSIESDLATAAVCRRAAPDCLTAVFGIHPTVLPEACFAAAPELDAVILGEPELAMRDLVLELAAGRRPADSPPPGVIVRRGAELARGPVREPLRDLDELPFPGWHLVERQRYTMPFTGRQFLLVATGRGCPHRCAMCADIAFYGHQLALRSPGRVADEMEYVRERFGIDEFLFWSESFTLNRRYSLAVARELSRRRSGFRWVCNSRVDNVDLELLAAFREAGCWMVGYGIESGRQATLDRMGKGTTLEQARQAVAWTHEAGLEATGHCVIGFPGETAADVRATAAFAIELDLDFAQFYCAVPFPGSALYAQALAAGWLSDTDWTHFEQNMSVLATPDLSARQVMDLRRECYRRFYLRPSMVLRTLRRLRSRRELRTFIGMSLDFLTWV